MSETYTTYGIGPDKQFDELQTLRDERDRLREALREIYEGRWTPGISCCYEDDARSIYPTREMRIRHIAQAALTPAGGVQQHPAFDEYGEHRQPTGLGDL